MWLLSFKHYILFVISSFLLGAVYWAREMIETRPGGHKNLNVQRSGSVESVIRIAVSIYYLTLYFVISIYINKKNHTHLTTVCNPLWASIKKECIFSNGRITLSEIYTKRCINEQQERFTSHYCMLVHMKTYKMRTFPKNYSADRYFFF